MQIKFLATGNAPDFYSFDGDKITILYEGQTEVIDFELLEYGDTFEGIETLLPLPSQQAIRQATRDSEGVLWVTLCQKSEAGHWRESEFIDSDNYSPENTYIRQITEQEAKAEWES